MASDVFKGLLSDTDSGLVPLFVSGYQESGMPRRALHVYKKAHKYINAAYFRVSGRDVLLGRGRWERILEEGIMPADIVHLHNVHGYYMPRSVLAEILRKPVVWTLHDAWLFTGRCAVPKTCEGWKQRCTFCPHRSWYPSSTRRDYHSEFDWKRRRLKLDGVTFTVPSAAALEDIQRFGVDNLDMRVIPNGVDTSVFKPVSSAYERRSILRTLGVMESEKPIVCYMSSNVEDPDKGFVLFSRACMRLKRSVKIVVIGHARRKVMDSCARLHPNITFVGFVRSREQIASILRISDVFVNPSVSETFGLTCLEALSCGAIPVVFEHRVFRETLGGFGVFADRGSVSSLAAAMERGILIGESRKDVVECYEHVNENYSTEKMVRGFRSLYNEKMHCRLSKENTLGTD